MNDRDRLFLRHVLNAFDEIASFPVEDQSTFMSDRKTQSAVILQLEIIGKAVKSLSADVTAGEAVVP